MAITIASLTSGNDPDNLSAYSTASVSPAANKLILFAIIASSSTAAALEVPSVAGCNLTWVEVASQGVQFSGPSPRGWFSLFRAMGGSPTTGAVTATYTTGRTSCAWSMVEVDGIDLSGTNGSGAIAQSATNFVAADTVLTVTLAAFENANNATFAGFAVYDNDIVTHTFTPGTGFTEIHDTGAQASSITTEWRADNDTTATITADSSESIGGIAIELRAASTPPIMLVLPYIVW